MRYRKSAVVSFNTLVWLILSVVAHADDWLPINPVELQTKSEPKALGAPAIYLYRQVDRDDVESIENVYYRIKILTEEGRKYADVEIPYDRYSENIGFVHARTIRPDGSIAEFNGTQFDKPIVQGNRKKLMAKTFTLSDVQVGGIIEYRYRRTRSDGYVYDSHWILSDDLFTKHAKFSLLPSGYFYLRYSWPIGLPEGATAPKREGSHIRMEVDNVPAFVTEDYMPPENQLKYRVDFIYHDGERSSDEPDLFWKTFGKQSFKKIDSFVDEKRAMKDAVEKIIDPNDETEVKLRKIYTRVQQIRNLSYERSKSEEERKRETPKEVKDVEDVWKRGYGSATQITWLFLALTRASGIEADPVLISTRDEYFFNKKVTNENQLNSNAVVVKLNGQDLYLDPGIPFTPFGLLPWYASGVTGLKLDKNGGTWLEIPLPKSEQSRIVRKAVLKLTNDGALEGKVVVTYTGLTALRQRLSERNDDDVDRNQYMEDELDRAIPVAAEIKLVNAPAWTSSDQSLVAEYELRVAGWANTAGKQSFLSMGLFAEREKHVFKHSMRLHPLYFSYPNETVDEFEITLPQSLSVTSVPEAFSLGGKVLSYSTSAEEKDGVLHIRRRFANGHLYLDVKAYPQILDFYQQMRTHDEQQVVVSASKAVKK